MWDLLTLFLPSVLCIFCLVKVIEKMRCSILLLGGSLKMLCTVAYCIEDLPYVVI